MKKVHRSKVDTWLGIVLGGVPVPLLFVIWKLFQESVPGRWLIVLPIVILGIFLPISLLFSTSYTITEESLLIRSGLFTWKIPLHDITAIAPTNDPLSSPALSLDRLRIDYGDGRRVMISPLDQEAFLCDLRAMNVPRIQRGAG